MNWRILLFAGIIALPVKQGISQVSIIPQPVHMLLETGKFAIDKHTGIQVPSGNKAVADVAVYLGNYIGQISGYQLSVTQTVIKGKRIKLEIVTLAGLSDEAYKIHVTEKEIQLQASHPKGLFYAVQSLIQTLPAIRTNQPLQIPCMQVEDYPRFQWRGMMLDVSRHFFSPELVKEFIDLLASYKLNTFHWHLVDGTGWRIEIKKYPKLTEQAAWRVDDSGKPWNWADIQFNADRNKATYGGFYTQEQIKEIVAYAASKYITIVPEIEMPGHSAAALAAYPEFSCIPAKDHFGQQGNFYARNVQNNYCAGNDSAFTFLQNVLKEVMVLFPSKYIHIGGDEVDKTSWKECSKCQHRMQAEGLKNEQELQSYFVRRIERFLKANNRKLIGWDEILEGGLAPEATVMSWRGESGGIKAAQMNHDVVMSPGTPFYFDHYQGDPETEPQAIGGFNTLKRVYNYDPIPAELGSEAAKHILGAQANLWTEYIPTFEHVEYMILPRMLALSEVLWSAKENRNWKQFSERLQPQLVGFEQKGLHYSKGNFKIDIKPQASNGKISVQLETEREDGMIYYTTDGTDPGTGSQKYDKPIIVNTSMILKAGLSINNSMVKARPAQQSFTLNKATGKTAQYLTPYSRYYPANGPVTLTDGMRGTASNNKQQWHGFSDNDLVATIDLGQATNATYISLGCLQQYDQWIFYPQWVKFEVSDTGEQYQELATIQNTVPATDRAGQTKDFGTRFATRTFRYVRITAKRLDQCPQGHPGEGKSAWLFCDEIIVE